MINHIHVIAFDLPWPPNYGGSTDMYFKLDSLHKLGIRITLHVFLYDGKCESEDLKSTVDELYYYPRKRLNPFIGKTPYIVKTRVSEQLFQRLLQDNSPILFEGLHTTFYANHPLLKDRIKVVRAHNVEHNYYEAVALAEDSWLKRIFFKLEAKRLKSYEKVLNLVNAIAAISPMETSYFQNQYGNAFYIPAFHSNEKVISKVGNGSTVLYHGNLSVPENNRAALFLAEKVFPFLNMPCIIAGSRPSEKLVKAIGKSKNITLFSNVPSDKILELIQDAQINVLVTFQSTGIKLKLLNSLYRGRFIVANTPMVAETDLDDLCTVADEPTEIIQAIDAIFQSSFNESEVYKRQQKLDLVFNNHENAIKLAKLLGSVVG